MTEYAMQHSACVVVVTAGIVRMTVQFIDR